MSAPKTNVEKQEKRHKTPLVGMVGVVAFAVVLLVLLTGWLTYSGNVPDSEEVEVTGGPADTMVED
ncbi:hypothetical protein [Tranquillimonas alkanivorans]|uniref:Uncharacterized protein n=1 Tax=Tranquillimonas alkanivorans TaxID=441119 RepID=A0A1I5MAM5_9RHOB|nr:hypothetical protein [Tranquillimonas alkanivorans]SFP06605.1 hypothetical protein SAMN04488047_102181 [Tranquillimonas alkanivorans]